MQTEEDKFKAIIDKFENSKTTLEAYEAISEMVQAIFDMKNFKAFEKAIDERSEMIFNANKELYNNRRYYTGEEVDQQTETLFQMNTAWFLRELHAVYDCLKPENFTLGQIWLFKFTKPDEPMREYRKKEYRRDIEKVYKAILPFLVQDKEIVTKQELTKNDVGDFQKALDHKDNIKWEDIEIIFKDDFAVEIRINNHKYESDYEKMGFADGRKNVQEETKAIASWNLLKLFSITENNEFEYGKLDSKDKRDKFKKSKQKLSQLLKNYFQIEDDPIIYNKDTGIYRMRIKLQPEEIYRKQWEDRNIIEGLR